MKSILKLATSNDNYMYKSFGVCMMLPENINSSVPYKWRMDYWRMDDGVFNVRVHLNMVSGSF